MTKLSYTGMPSSAELDELGKIIGIERDTSEPDTAYYWRLLNIWPCARIGTGGSTCIYPGDWIQNLDGTLTLEVERFTQGNSGAPGFWAHGTVVAGNCVGEKSYAHSLQEFWKKLARPEVKPGKDGPRDRTGSPLRVGDRIENEYGEVVDITSIRESLAEGFCAKGTNAQGGCVGAFDLGTRWRRVEPAESMPADPPKEIETMKDVVSVMSPGTYPWKLKAVHDAANRNLGEWSGTVSGDPYYGMFVVNTKRGAESCEFRIPAELVREGNEEEIDACFRTPWNIIKVIRAQDELRAAENNTAMMPADVVPEWVSVGDDAEDYRQYQNKVNRAVGALPPGWSIVFDRHLMCESYALYQPDGVLFARERGLWGLDGLRAAITEAHVKHSLHPERLRRPRRIMKWKPPEVQSFDEWVKTFTKPKGS